jgi:hypothetical protein
MEQRPDTTSKLEPDVLIERLVPDASQIPDVRVLVGFLGKSTRERHWRLYLTPTLNEYVEFAEDDVMHSHAFESDESRLGGTMVWVRREANLQHTRTVSREAQADFLQGGIAASVAMRCGLPRILPFQAQFYQPGGGIPSNAFAGSCVKEFCHLVAETEFCTFTC